MAVLDRVLAPLEASWDGRTQSRPIAEAYLVRARALAARGDLDFAFESIDRAERASAQDLPRALRLRADLLLAAGRRDLAAHALERLLLEGSLSEGDARRVARELEFVTAWSTARRLVEEDFSRGKVERIAGNLLAGDPLRPRIETGALVLRLSPTRPASYGVPLRLDGRTFEASTSLLLPPPTAGVRAEWGLFREGGEGDLLLGAIAEGQGPEAQDGYRWSVRVPGATAPEEAGRWSQVVLPQARLVLSYESRSRRVELRVETGRPDASTIVWTGDLANDFPSGDCRFGLRASPCRASATVREIRTTALSFRAVTLASSLQWPAGTPYERACGAAALGDQAQAFLLLGRVDPPTAEARVGRAVLLAEDPARRSDAEKAVVEAIAADEAGAVQALGALIPSMRPEGVEAVVEGLARAFEARDAVERLAAAREARHRGDAGAVVAYLASVVKGEEATLESRAWCAEALLALDQPRLAVEQAARVVRNVEDRQDAIRRQCVSILWRCWNALRFDPAMNDTMEEAGQAPAVFVAAVDAHSGAGAAGLRAGDQFLTVDGKPIRLTEQLQEAFDEALSTGRASLSIRVLRERQEMRFDIPVGPHGMTLRQEWFELRR